VRYDAAEAITVERSAMATSDPGDLIYEQRRRRGWSKARLCEEIQSWDLRSADERGFWDMSGLRMQVRRLHLAPRLVDA
jgi:hypothetical protein